MNIYWDIQNHEFVKSLTRGSTVQKLSWTLRDQVPVVLYIVTPNDSDQSYTAQEATAGFSVKFTAKQAASLTGAALIFQGTWTLVGTGAAAYYTGTIDLNVEGLITAVEAATNHYVDLVAEFVLQDANGVHQDSTQVTLRVTEDVLRGTESTPVAATLPWPYLEWFTDENGYKCARLLNEDGETLEVFKPAGAP
jgi:hypothetical protein